MHAAVILFSFLLSCGPEDCDDLEFQVDQVLDQEEITWQNHLAAYKVCERACSDTEDSCMDMANGIGIDPLDTGLVLPGADEQHEGQRPQQHERRRHPQQIPQQDAGL